jgi:hypothetical protein
MVKGRAVARFALGLFCVLLLACEKSSPTAPGGSGSVAFETVLKTILPGAAPLHLVEQVPIRDRATWQSAWFELHRQSGSIPPLPEINFSRDVVVLALGPGCCGGVEIVTAEYRNSDLVVSGVAKVSTNTACLAGDFSVHIVRLRRVEGLVHLYVKTEEKLC